MSVHDLQAPAQNGAVLLHPPLDDAVSLVRRNQERLSLSPATLAGKSLETIRTQARADVWKQAQAYHAEAGEPLATGPGACWIVAGHQPGLFHPGVWLKNFLIQGLARQLGGTSLNLVVDNDLAHQPVLHVPGDRLLPVPFDEWHGEAPYEERLIEDVERFRLFPNAVAKHAAAWPFQPLLPDFWIDVLIAARQTRQVAECFVRARRGWERRFGGAPLELPVSRLCRTDAFAAFAAEILATAARFREAYNGAVAAYRSRYRLRSVNHPVPDLGADGDWIETPLWGWRAGAARRGRLFVRRGAAGIELRCDRDGWPTLPGEARALAAAFPSMEERGYKIRPRALSLTLFTRLCLADLFVHGLGGGKYDEVTDELMRRFFHLEPPAFLVATGTLRLPFPPADATQEDYRRLSWKVRDLEFNPQRHIASGARLSRRDQELLLTKAVLMRHKPQRHHERKDRFFQIRQLNEELHPLIDSQLQSAKRERRRIASELSEHAVRQRRDYSFCLYPEEMLRAFLNVG